MKKIFSLILVFTALFFCLACGDDGGVNATVYYIRADVDLSGGGSEAYAYLSGLSDAGAAEVPFGNIVNDTTDYTGLWASYLVDSLAASDSNIYIEFEGTDSGTYVNGVDGIVRVYLMANLTSGLDYETDSCTVEVTSYGEVDEPIEGEFNGTTAAGDTITGIFKVKRIDDNSFAP